MAQGRVSKTSVDRLTCPQGKDRAFLWDDDLAGFGVVAFPQVAGKPARKVYVAQYRQDGRSRRTKIGAHGALTADEARTEAKKLLGDVARGVDPVARRRAAKAVPTLREVADDFMARHVGPKKRSSTSEAYETLLRRHILPAIGSKRVTELRRADVARLHGGIGQTTPGAANRALSLISALWNWAGSSREDGELFATNPAKSVERFGEEGTERFLSTAEMARIGDALAKAETTGLAYEVDEEAPKAKHAAKPANRLRQIDPYAVAAIRLLMLTGARLREILHAEWRQVDFERGLLNLPTSKTGKKSVYLSAAALAVLSGLKPVKGNPHIIAGAKDYRPRSDLKRPWAAITTEAKLTGLRIHDLRHSFASVGAGASLGLPIIGKLLGHAQPATTARYAHLDADPMRRAVDTIGATITAAMEGRKPRAEIVPIRKGA